MPGLSLPARNVPGDPVVSELRMFVRIIWRGRGEREGKWRGIVFKGQSRLRLVTLSQII